MSAVLAADDVALELAALRRSAESNISRRMAAAQLGLDFQQETTMTTTANNDDVFSLSPAEFRAQEAAERRAADEARAAEAVRAEAETENAARKEAAARAAAVKRWTTWLTNIAIMAVSRPAVGAEEAFKRFKIEETDGLYRPVRLTIDGVEVPVGEGLGSWFTLEISMPWYTARYDSLRGRREPVDKASSRQRKDGSFDYEKLGGMARRYVEAVKWHEREEGAKAGATNSVKALAEELGYSNMEPSVNPEKPVLFKFSMNREMTADEARAAHAALVAAGLIKQK